MSDQPLGRDRLGRLVYAGDYVWPHKQDDPYWIPVWKEDDGRVAFDEGLGMAEHTTWPEFVTIDLNASPKRSFYERYFADLGTINQIIVAYMDDALQSDDLFWFDFEHDLWWDYGHAGFETWLKQEASV